MLFYVILNLHFDTFVFFQQVPLTIARLLDDNANQFCVLVLELVIVTHRGFFFLSFDFSQFVFFALELCIITRHSSNLNTFAQNGQR